MADQEVAKLIIRIVAEFGDLKKQFSDLKNQMKDTADNTKGFSESFKGGIASIKTAYLAAVAEMYIAYRAVEKFMEWAELGGRAMKIKDAFDTITKSLQVDGDTLLKNIEKIAPVFVNKTDVMQKAMRLLSEGFTPAQVEQLTKSAVIFAKLTGNTISEAWDALTEAIITGRTRAIRRLVPLSEQEIFRKFAGGMDPAKLSEFGKQQAMLQEVWRQAGLHAHNLGMDLENLGGSVDKMAPVDKMERARSQWKEFTEEIGKMAALGFSEAYTAISNFIDVLDSLNKQIAKTSFATFYNQLNEWIGNLERKIPGIRSLIPAAPAKGGPGEITGVMTREEIAKAWTEVPEKPSIWQEPDLRKIQEEILKYQKETGDQLVKLAQAEAENEKAVRIAGAMTTGEDVEAIEMQYALKAADRELKQQFDRVEAARREALNKAEAERLGRGVIAAINERFNTEEQAEWGKNEAKKADITAKWMKTIGDRRDSEEKGWLDRTLSNTDLEIAQLDDLYNHNFITPADYYSKKAILQTKSITDEVQRLQKQLITPPAAGGVMGIPTREQEVMTELIKKTNEAAKQEIAIDNEAIQGGQKKLDLAVNLNKAVFERADIQTQIQRQRLDITEAEALRRQIDTQEKTLALLQNELVAMEKFGVLTDEQKTKYSDIQTQISQTRARIQELNSAYEEQTGSVLRAMEKGWKEYFDGLKTNFQTVREGVKDNLKTAGDEFEKLLKDMMTGATRGKDWGKNFLKGMLDSFAGNEAKQIRQLFENLLFGGKNKEEFGIKGGLVGQLFELIGIKKAPTAAPPGSVGFGAGGPSGFGIPEAAKPGFETLEKSTDSLKSSFDDVIKIADELVTSFRQLNEFMGFAPKTPQAEAAAAGMPPPEYATHGATPEAFNIEKAQYTPPPSIAETAAPYVIAAPAPQPIELAGGLKVYGAEAEEATITKTIKALGIPSEPPANIKIPSYEESIAGKEEAWKQRLRDQGLLSESPISKAEFSIEEGMGGKATTSPSKIISTESTKAEADVKQLWTTFSSGLNHATHGVTGFISSLASMLNSIGKLINPSGSTGAGGGIGGLFSAIFSSSPSSTASFPIEEGFQKGGTFWATKPTRILIGEGAEPEHVSITPLSKMVPRGVFGPMGKSSELRPFQGFQEGGQIISVPSVTESGTITHGEEGMRPEIHIHVNAIDTQNAHDFIVKHGETIANQMSRLWNGNHPSRKGR